MGLPDERAPFYFLTKCLSIRGGQAHVRHSNAVDKVPDFDPKDKTAIAPAELLAYLKALAKELEFMTFGEEKTR